MLDFESDTPILRNSPLIRRRPQRGLFFFISTTNNRMSSVITGRPILAREKSHFPATRALCHLITVSGFIVYQTLRYTLSHPRERN